MGLVLKAVLFVTIEVLYPYAMGIASSKLLLGCDERGPKCTELLKCSAPSAAVHVPPRQLSSMGCSQALHPPRRGNYFWTFFPPKPVPWRPVLNLRRF